MRGTSPGWIPLLRGVGLGAAALLLVGNAAGPPVPWPFGSAPTSVELREMVEDALMVGGRERLDELRSTQDKDEEVESTQIPQRAVDGRVYDIDALFAMGDELFAHEFRAEGGLGGLVPATGIRRVHRGLAGGIDTYSCAGCHSVGGLDGAGAVTQTAMLLGDGNRASSTLRRNPPSLLGGGLLQAIGVEMSTELQQQRALALEQAARSGQPVEAALSAKGVSFGTLLARPDGSMDTSRIEGVSTDLVVRPFGWKGDVARLRRMVEEAARIHFGAQSQVLVEQGRDAPDPERLGSGPDWWDPDADGREREIDEGSLSAAAVYLALLETPEIIPPRDPVLLDRWGRGDTLFDEVGCASCHMRVLRLESRSWEEHPDSTDGPPVVLQLLRDGEQPRGSDRVMAFSDLKRHDMGPDLADPIDNPAGIPPSVFLTRPLWGLAETPPYLHDGRAATIPEAILAHGGEARASRDAFAALSPEDQASLHVFLLSLSRHPKPRMAR